MSKLINVVIGALGLLIPLGGLCATFKVDQSRTDFVTIYISGEIRKQDVESFQKIIARLPKLTGSFSGAVHLDSNGGDVDAAMQIGRLIRAAQMMTWTHSTDFKNPRVTTCVSSCVLIFAGGVFRSSDYGFGDGSSGLGIHRPYDTEVGKIELGRADQKYKTIEARFRAYLREMNIAERFVDEAFRIPPNEVKFLTKKEATDLMLLGEDPAFAEMQIAADAGKRGISKTEWYTRWHKKDTECGPRNLEAWGSCALDVMEGKR